MKDLVLATPISGPAWVKKVRSEFLVMLDCLLFGTADAPCVPRIVLSLPAAFEKCNLIGIRVVFHDNSDHTLDSPEFVPSFF